MKPSARRGRWWFAFAVATSAAVPSLASLPVVPGPKQWGVSLFLIAFFCAFALLCAVPVWRGRRTRYTGFWNPVTFGGRFALIYWNLSSGLFAVLIGAARFNTTGCTTTTTCAVAAICAACWAGSLIILWRSRDLRRFFGVFQRLRRATINRQIVALFARVETLRNEFRAGTLPPGIPLDLPPLPPVGADGAFRVEPQRGWAWMQRWWQIVIADAIGHAATGVYYEPSRREHQLFADYPGGRYAFGLSGERQALTLSLAATFLIPRPLRARRRLVAFPTPADYRLSVTSEFGASEWLMAVWRYDTDWGVHWHRLDLTPETRGAGGVVITPHARDCRRWTPSEVS